MSDRPPLTPDIFDSEFRVAARSEWTRRVIGADLPAEVDPFSFITTDGLHQIAEALVACRGGTLVDLACGRGGPGLWLARQIGAALVGIDFSPVGIDHARARSAEFAPELSVRYVVADAGDTGLPQESAAGLITVSIDERPDWLARERAIFERALADAPRFPADESLQSLAAEAKEALPRFGEARRVLGVAEKPSLSSV